MNELGMLVDVSHCGPQTTLDAIEASPRPIAITHSNCAAVYATPRAKTDEAIQALARRGGVMGITFLNFFVGPRPRQTINDVIAHIDHVRQVAGIDSVAIGSDLPIGSFLETYPDESSFMKALEPYIAASGSTYIRWPATIDGLDGPQKLRTLAAALAERGYTATDIRKVLGLNFLRVLEASIG
jgi:membrane dipeptidase